MCGVFSNSITVKSTIIIFVVIFSLFFNHFLVAQNESEETIARIKKDVSILAHDSMVGRFPGTIGEQRASDYLLAQFVTIGLKPVLSDNAYLQPFEFAYKNELINTKNLIGLVDNEAPQTIVVAAHYDHIGYGGEYSRELDVRAIHNGADDNASGVAVMLELARYFNNNHTQSYNFLFCAFSAHETGLIGSTWFVNSEAYDLSNISFMINLDMVGRLDTSAKIVMVNGSSSSTVFDTIFSTTEVEYFTLLKTEERLLDSDQKPFYDNRIPVLCFSTGIHEDYHKSTDDSDRINYRGMLIIIQYIEELIKNSCEFNDFPFIKVE